MRYTVESTKGNKENVILAAVIPGPDEPHLMINSYLDPIVSDLNKLWNGIKVEGKIIHVYDLHR